MKLLLETTPNHKRLVKFCSMFKQEIEKMLKAAQSGKPVNINDLPPPVATGL